MLGSAHHDGWPFPEGGAGRISEALAAELRSLGGTIETGRDVAALDDLPRSRAAVFDTSPRALEEVARSRLPDGYRRKLRGYRYGPSVFKLDIAIEGEVPWRNEAVRRAGTVHLGGTFEEIAQSEADATAGRVNERPFVLLAQQSVFDRSRAPVNRNAIWAYSHVPHATTVDYTETHPQPDRALRARLPRADPEGLGDQPGRPRGVQPEQRRGRHVRWSDRPPAAVHPSDCSP